MVRSDHRRPTWPGISWADDDVEPAAGPAPPARIRTGAAGGASIRAGRVRGRLVGGGGRDPTGGLRGGRARRRQDPAAGRGRHRAGQARRGRPHGNQRPGPRRAVRAIRGGDRPPGGRESFRGRPETARRSHGGRAGPSGAAVRGKSARLGRWRRHRWCPSGAVRCGGPPAVHVGRGSTGRARPRRPAVGPPTDTGHAEPHRLHDRGHEGARPRRVPHDGHGPLRRPDHGHRRPVPAGGRAPHRPGGVGHRRHRGVPGSPGRGHHARCPPVGTAAARPDGRQSVLPP